MGRAALLLMIAAMIAPACRDGDEPAIPGPAPKVAADRAPDAGVPDAIPADARLSPPLGMRPPGSGGTPAAMDPRAVSCPDPAIGVWVAKTFADAESRWHEHRLSIARGADDELVADQTTRIWNGGPADGLPSLCPGGGGPAWGVYKIRDKARFVDGILHVWGVAVDSSTHTCDGEILSYNLDSFTGRVHKDVYKARNNDGSMAVNRPYYFRRISCTPD